MQVPTNERSITRKKTFRIFSGIEEEIGILNNPEKTRKELQSKNRIQMLCQIKMQDISVRANATHVDGNKKQLIYKLRKMSNELLPELKFYKAINHRKSHK